MKMLDWLCLILVVIGALNWGLVGVFQFDLVASIFGSMSLISRAVYAAVGFAGLVVMYTRFRVK